MSTKYQQNEQQLNLSPQIIGRKKIMTKWRWKSGLGLGQTQNSYGINDKNDSSEWYINKP